MNCFKIGGWLKNNTRYREKFDSRQSVSHPLLILVAFTLLLITLISCSPHLQNHGRIPETKTAEQIIIEMKNWADLTDEQEVKIRPIIEEQVKKRNALIKKYKGKDREAIISLKDGLKELRVTTAKELQYFLTNKQMIEYGGMQQEEDERIGRRNVRQEMNPQKPGGRGPR